VAGAEGFLCYWRGNLDDEGYCRSFCLWTSGQEAMLASRQPAHIAAARMVGEFYETWNPNGYEVTCQADGTMEFELVRPLGRGSSTNL
jgi:hypothetical protein